MHLRDAVGKFVICVVQLGGGASLGREGPTVQISAGISTSLGQWVALSPANLRRLIPVGAAAGVAAAFNAPIAAVTFTIEEIVGSLDQTVLSGVVVAAALAAVVEHSILGENPLLHAPAGAGLHHASSLVFYALLGACAAFVSIAFTDLLLAVRARAKAPGAEAERGGRPSMTSHRRCCRVATGTVRGTRVRSRASASSRAPCAAVDSRGPCAEPGHHHVGARRDPDVDAGRMVLDGRGLAGALLRVAPIILREAATTPASGGIIA